MTQILRLAVAPVEPGEDAEDLGGALRGQRRVEPRESGGVETPVVGAARAGVAAEQRDLQRFRHVDARVLQQRGDVVGGGTDQRVLEIEQADARNAFALGSHSRLGE